MGSIYINFYLKQNKEVQLHLRFEIFTCSSFLPTLQPGKMLEEKLTYRFLQFGIWVSRQASELVSKCSACNFPFSEFWIFLSLLDCYFSEISCTYCFGKCLIDSEQIILIIFKFGPTIFMYVDKSLRRQVSFCSR